jgi:carboxypeptidase C (cathepsin A)
MLLPITCLLSLLAVPSLALGSGLPRLTERPLQLLNRSKNAADSTPQQIAGYFKLDRTYDARMFYFYFESRSMKPTDPLVLWMTGGPGCSSELAVFYENGPFHIKDDLTLEESEYGWDVNHNMIFVDQPINTGFSYSDDPRDRIYDEHGVAEDMLDFFQEFLAAHPELDGREVYITGESYAGHYVPAVSNKLFTYNKEANTTKPINFKGLAVGNGLTDPTIQYGAYSDYAVMNKLISESTRTRMRAIYPLCKFGAQICNRLKVGFVCELALVFCQDTQFAPVMVLNPTMNVYDIRKKCIGPLCYDFSKLDRYINQESVRKELGVGDRKWEACSMSVHADMMGDWLRNYDTVIPGMLQDGIRVMIYAGVEDFICNWVGNQRWVDALPWSGSGKWAGAPERKWAVNGTEAGTVKNVGPLTFVKVAGAGHMVPMDQPLNSLDMLTRFTRNRTFAMPADGIRLPTQPLLQTS